MHNAARAHAVDPNFRLPGVDVDAQLIMYDVVRACAASTSWKARALLRNGKAWHQLSAIQATDGQRAAGKVYIAPGKNPSRPAPSAGASSSQTSPATASCVRERAPPHPAPDGVALYRGLPFVRARPASRDVAAIPQWALEAAGKLKRERGAMNTLQGL